MRLCYVSDERFPSTHADTQQVALTMDALATTGIDALLVAPKFTRGTYAVGQEAAMREYYGVGDGFAVEWVRTVDPNMRELVKTLHPAQAMRAVARHRPDVVYTRNLQIALLAISLGHRVAFESYRIVDRRFPRLASLFAKVAGSARFLGVITHSELSAAGFRRVGVASDKVRVVYNGVSMKQMEPRLPKDAARAACGLPGDGTLVAYAGHVRAHKGIESLAEVARVTPSMHHVWVGGDNEGSATWARECAAAAGASNVRVTGWLTAREVSPYLYAADALLIPPASSPLTKFGNTVLPIKLFSYLASGRTIVAPALPDLKELVTHDENACLYEPDSVDAARAALERVSADPALRERLGKAALASARALTWDARAVKIRRFLEERLEVSRAAA